MIYRRCHNASCASQLKASLLWSPSDFWFFWYFSYRLNFRNPPSGTWSHEILGGVGEIQDIQVSHYIWPLCYSYHMLPYVIIIIFDLLLYFAIFYLCYQYCSKVFDPPPIGLIWKRLEDFFSETVSRPCLQSWMFTLGVTSLQSYAPTSAIMPCITCKPIRPNISTSSRYI